jgi:hypothetical protein
MSEVTRYAAYVCLENFVLTCSTDQQIKYSRSILLTCRLRFVKPSGSSQIQSSSNYPHPLLVRPELGEDLLGILEMLDMGKALSGRDPLSSCKIAATTCLLKHPPRSKPLPPRHRDIHTPKPPSDEELHGEHDSPTPWTESQHTRHWSERRNRRSLIWHGA